MTVQRRVVTELTTIGDVSVDGIPFGVTLEPAAHIPAGSYKVQIIQSPKFTAKYGFPFLVPELQDVPGHTGIEMHIGNYPDDTTGCTLIGTAPGRDMIGNSEPAFMRLFHRMMADPENITATYIDPV